MGVPVLYAGSKYYPGIPPDKQYPAFSSAEVGNVNASTVAVTFSVNISASDYATGVTIKVNGSAATISSATRQANHAIVYYALSAAVVNGDTVTWEYSGGSIVNEATGAGLQTVSAQSVTNNVAVPVPTALLGLESDTLLLSDGDPVSLWTDGTTDFTQTGTARPVKQTVSTYPTVVFDGTDSSLIGNNTLADNLDAFTIFMVFSPSGGSSGYGIILSKINNLSSGAGWLIYADGFNVLTQEDGGSVWYEQDYAVSVGLNVKKVYSYVFISRNSFQLYVNGVLQAPSNTVNHGPVMNISTTETVKIGADGNASDGGSAYKVYAVRIYDGVFDNAGRATVEAELATRYGITL